MVEMSCTWFRSVDVSEGTPWELPGQFVPVFSINRKKLCQIKNADGLSCAKHTLTRGFDAITAIEQGYTSADLPSQRACKTKESLIEWKWTSSEYVFSITNIVILDKLFLNATLNYPHPSFVYPKRFETFRTCFFDQFLVFVPCFKCTVVTDNFCTPGACPYRGDCGCFGFHIKRKVGLFNYGDL
jgi:hypothetical protein